jgi:hypothetical protein
VEVPKISESTLTTSLFPRYHKEERYRENPSHKISGRRLKKPHTQIIKFLKHKVKATEIKNSFSNRAPINSNDNLSHPSDATLIFHIFNEHLKYTKYLPQILRGCPARRTPSGKRAKSPKYKRPALIILRKVGDKSLISARLPSVRDLR